MTDSVETIPVQYREGRASFMGMSVKVDSRVLIPRPETELLVTVAARLLSEKKWSKPFVLDVGTGSGIIPLGLMQLIDDCRIIGTDKSTEALTLARENIMHFDREDRVALFASDMFSGFNRTYEGAFNCVVSNPPYVSEKDYGQLDAWVKTEPRQALYAGAEGMDYLNIIARESGRFITTGGFVAVEVGYDQAEKVKKAFHERGFKDIAGFRDFNGYERVIVGWKRG